MWLTALAQVPEVCLRWACSLQGLSHRCRPHGNGALGRPFGSMVCIKILPTQQLFCPKAVDTG